MSTQDKTTEKGEKPAKAMSKSAGKANEQTTATSQGDVPDKDLGIGVLEAIYPEAEQAFFFRPKSLAEIKNNCLIVLDTNVLLLPYRTGNKSLDEIKHKYAPLVERGRLIVPAHVAREFVRNRTKYIKELYQQIALKQNIALQHFTKSTYPFLKSDPAYEAILEHEREIEKVKECFTEYRNSIKQLLNSITSWDWSDPISVLYQELFEGKNVIREAKISEKALRADLDRRLSYRIPPGYNDESKATNAEGDLLIWHTILELGEDTQKNVIFVSGDDKNDWRCRSYNQSLYARHELVDEFRHRSGGQSFHMIDFSEFLQLFEASDDVIQEIEYAEEAQHGEEWAATGAVTRLRIDEKAPLSDQDYAFRFGAYEKYAVPSLVAQQMQRQRPDVGQVFIASSSPVDFWLKDAEDSDALHAIPVIVKDLEDISISAVFAYYNQVLSLREQYDWDRCLLVLVSRDIHIINWLESILGVNDHLVDRDRVSVLLAYLTDTNYIHFRAAFGPVAARWTFH